MSERNSLQIQLSEPERVWLRGLYERFLRKEQPDIWKMRLELRDKLPADFRPSRIDGRLGGGKRITLFAIVALDRTSTLLSDVEAVIIGIRDFLIAHPDVRRVRASEIAARLGTDEVYTERLFELISDAGTFWSGAASGSGGQGFSVLQLDREENLAAFLAFQGLEESLRIAWAERSPRQEAAPSGATVPSALPNTAFIIMQMNRSLPELEDVLNTIKDVCEKFGVEANRADEIEHEGKITDVILERIRLAEFLIADLSGERPNVYYEVGYAHALNKKPILYRRAGTPLHFDLLVHNVPEYENLTELRSLLMRRLEAILGRGPRMG